MCLSFKINRKTLCKESVKKDTKENQVIEQKGNRIYQPEEEKIDEGIGKWKRRSKGADLGYNNANNIYIPDMQKTMHQVHPQVAHKYPGIIWRTSLEVEYFLWYGS